MRLLLLALMLVLLLGSAALAASPRPNALDLRVDTLSRAALMTQPATTLVDPARQAAALRRAHWTVVGWLLMALFEAAALFWLWNSGGAAALRDRLRHRLAHEWEVRFLFGAALALVARLAAFLPAFYLYRVDRTLDLTFELTRWWALFWAFHTLVAMAIAGAIAAAVLWLASRTHQWYLYAIVAILAVSVGWSYAAEYVNSAGTHLVRTPSGATVRVNDLRVAGSTPAEVAYVAAYELGHITNGDRLSMALIEGGVIIVFGALAVGDRRPHPLSARRRPALSPGIGRHPARARLHRCGAGAQCCAALVRFRRRPLRGRAHQRLGSRGAFPRA